MSIFYGLDTEAYDRSYTDQELIRRILSYFVPHRRRVLIVAALIAAIAVAGAAQPFVVARGLDALVASAAQGLLLGLGVVVLAIGVFNWGGNWLRRRLTARVIGDVVLALRHEAFRASVQHDMSFFDEFQSGRIISRITSDTQEFAQVVLLVTDLIGQLLLVLILVVALFTVSWQLTLMLLALSPLVILLASGFRRAARYVTRRGFRALAEVNAAIQEAITGISVAKNFRQERAIYDSFGQVNRQSYGVNLWRGFVLSNVFPVLNVLAGIGTAALTYWGGLTTVTGSLSVGSWYLFIISVDRFWFPMINVAAFWSQFQAGLSAAERIFALIDAEPTVQQTTPPQGRTNQPPLEQLRGDIVFDRVSFYYTQQEQILQDFSLRIEPGESVALVGHTGAGKSSIVKLITRFYEFQGGQIAVDGHDIRTLDLHNYRRQLGIVSQSPFLFSGTVADNIRYARRELSDAEIEDVARRIGGGEWLETLPNGLATDVGERGSRLSMGQRQLVALARVLAQAPAIFILDEATASIDPFTESQIQEAMDLILQCSTSILIAHRLSTVRAVDRIIVLDHGTIIEQGNHERLMARGGHYAELYDTYFRHQSPDYKAPELTRPPVLASGKISTR
jgi:ATP-binding cassette subfamily B protein